MMPENYEHTLFNTLKKIFDEKKRRESFIPGETVIHYAWAIFDHKEIFAALESLISGWLGLGKNAREFEEAFASFLGTKHCVITNSGSSANLLAVEALKLPKGSEVITPPVTFPTTFNPLIKCDLKPVFVDVNPTTYNIDVFKLEKAISKDTKLIMLPHTLGNPNEMAMIMELAEKYDLFIIEDACDALGSRYNGKYVSTFGDLGTFSFYPAHHITMGEGGAVVTDDNPLSLTIRSLRDWGRACVCPVCKLALDPNAYCQLRFLETPISEYDRRFTYINMGYNLKPLDVQAAIGLQQLKRLPQFIEKRKENFTKLHEELSEFEDYFILPESMPNADPCWFAFPITVRDDAPFRRAHIVDFLETKRIASRPLFAGNILKQPAYANINCRVVGTLKNSDRVMSSSFFIGIHPGIDGTRLSYIVDSFKNFIKKEGKTQ